MLVLSRSSGSSVEVGNTTVTVLEIRGDYVRLGFVGPDLVLRSEVKQLLPVSRIAVAYPCRCGKDGCDHKACCRSVCLDEIVAQTGVGE